MSPRSTPDPEDLGSDLLSVALIGPSDRSRRPIASALAGLRGSVTRESISYPDLDDLPRLLDTNFDVIILELDSDPEHALDLVESICGSCAATVMVYSEHVFPEMLVRCMRAGAREFLTLPITGMTIAEALVRASVRRPSTRVAKRAAGKLLVFVGAKGGSGVTTLASNFAVSLAQESGKNTLLIDLNLPLGNAALELGITNIYSSANALQNFTRLDSHFLSKLLVKHISGLSVLPAPDKYTELEVSREAVERLLAIARQDFDYVVVDAGTRFDSINKCLFAAGSTIYLVLQVGISELRNANRLISELFHESGVKLEIVLNRFAPRMLAIDEGSIAKALTKPATWKIPNDYAAARGAQDAATPLVQSDSAVSRAIQKMARAAGGLADVKEKKKFSFFSGNS